MKHFARKKVNEKPDPTECRDGIALIRENYLRKMQIREQNNSTIDAKQGKRTNSNDFSWIQ
jgi:hypothetical protein